ncbi:hypothetical protein DOY81_013230, partial [Sarcophaga bullata]
ITSASFALAYANEDANVIKSYSDVGVDQIQIRIGIDNSI